MARPPFYPSQKQCKTGVLLRDKNYEEISTTWKGSPVKVVGAHAADGQVD